MRSINENDYVDFTYECGTFKVTVQKLGDVTRLAKERNCPFTITGRKADGGVTIIDSREF